MKLLRLPGIIVLGLMLVANTVYAQTPATFTITDTTTVADLVAEYGSTDV